jgi:hypothetical protein
MGWWWFGHGASSIFLKWWVDFSVGGFLPFWIQAHHHAAACPSSFFSRAVCWCLHQALCRVWPSCCSDRKLPPPHLPLDAWLVAMSRSSFVVHRLLCPNLCTRVSLVVPKMKALITSALVRLVSSLRCREKR